MRVDVVQTVLALDPALLAPALAGGVMAAIVGGASVITFPVLLAVGLPPVVATASNLVAVSAGNFLAAFLTAASAAVQPRLRRPCRRIAGRRA